jgi:hypothetical protein
MDKKLVAQNTRRHLQRRLSVTLGCAPEDLGKLKLGTLIHFAFLFDGKSEELGGFSTTMSAVLCLLGDEIVWADPKESEDEPAKAVQTVIN